MNVRLRSRIQPGGTEHVAASVREGMHPEIRRYTDLVQRPQIPAAGTRYGLRSGDVVGGAVDAAFALSSTADIGSCDRFLEIETVRNRRPTRPMRKPW